jgi:hypothetical protein
MVMISAANGTGAADKGATPALTEGRLLCLPISMAVSFEHLI